MLRYLSIAQNQTSISSKHSIMPWDEKVFVPRTASGKQKSPNQIRNELQKYIDSSSKTQTYIVDNLLMVNSDSFREFMNPKTYKDQWSATQNSTYWSAARLLEKHKFEQKMTKKKRKRDDDAASVGGPPKKSKAMAKAEMDLYIEQVLATFTSQDEPEFVYDSCPEVIKKIKEFLNRDGVTKASFLRALGLGNATSLNRFLTMKKQDGCGMLAYPRAYFFFEKMRILENNPKSRKRLENEMTHPSGFSIEAPRRGKCMFPVF